MFPHEKDSAKYEESKTGRSMEEEERNTFTRQVYMAPLLI